LCCSSSDHAADCADAGCGGFRSPIRGCCEKASIQSEILSPSQISSEAASSDASSFSGLRTAIFRAHAADPLAQLEVETEDFVWLTEEFLGVADRHAKGRVVSVLEGGYDLDALADSAAAHVRVLMGN